MQDFHFSQSLQLQRLAADFHQWRSDELMIGERIAQSHRANELLRCGDGHPPLRICGRAAALPNTQITSARRGRDPFAEHFAELIILRRTIAALITLAGEEAPRLSVSFL